MGYGIFLLGMWCWIMEIFVIVILDMENFQLWFWSWGFFGHVCTMWFLVWEFFWSCDFGMRIFWTWFLAWNEYIYIFFVGMEIWNGMRFFCWHGISFFDILMMGQTLFCRISKVEVAFKCWKAHGKYCLQISGILLMMRASKLFWRLYRIKNPMSTRIFRYSLLCQNVFRTPCVLSIFRALVK